MYIQKRDVKSAYCYGWNARMSSLLSDPFVYPFSFTQFTMSLQFRWFLELQDYLRYYLFPRKLSTRTSQLPCMTFCRYMLHRYNMCPLHSVVPFRDTMAPDFPSSRTREGIFSFEQS